jgi:hypothetical protein
MKALLLITNNNNKMKKSFIPLLTTILLLATLLSGCASEKILDQGTVIKIEKIADKSYKPGQETAVGAGIGAGSGAAIGALVGASTATALTIVTFGAATPFIPGIVAGSALMGSGFGAATGGTAGYVKGIHDQGSGLYQFTVQPDNKKSTIVVTQPMKENIQLDDDVVIYVKKGNLQMKKID